MVRDAMDEVGVTLSVQELDRQDPRARTTDPLIEASGSRYDQKEVISEQ